MIVIIYRTSGDGYQVMGPFLDRKCAEKYSKNLETLAVVEVTPPKEIVKHLPKTMRQELQYHVRVVSSS